MDRKTLLMIVNLFIEVEQLQTAEGLLRTIGEGQQSLDSRYYVRFLGLCLACVDSRKEEGDNYGVESL